ncbi:hypothetical protein BHS01_00110 [Lactococcus paracarnosus]|uniref:Uncharacterized protein n=1 Tax=Pseudolactococcus paracarnosus TaxID=2749962 RepID=A0A7L4WB25_9LACT|nr:hypothetical protein BHS01_00110 [Lactococcus paracarnosus]
MNYRTLINDFVNLYHISKSKIAYLLQIGSIIFVNKEQIEIEIQKQVSKIINIKQHMEKLSSFQDKRPIPQ